MAQIEEGGTGSRSVNVDLNIVPFIDLMSVCIIFLLITAVWTQVSMIQIGSSVYGKRTDVGDQSPPPKPDVFFKIEIRPTGYRVLLGRQVTRVLKKDGEYDQKKLIEVLKNVKQRYPQKTDAMIAVAEQLNYEDMIKGMDSLLYSGFPEVSISTEAL